jgi:hypothetical protein
MLSYAYEERSRQRIQAMSQIGPGTWKQQLKLLRDAAKN